MYWLIALLIFCIVNIVGFTTILVDIFSYRTLKNSEIAPFYLFIFIIAIVISLLWPLAMVILPVTYFILRKMHKDVGGELNFIDWILR